MTEVEGGLDEPTELEPEQGSLDLAAPEDDHGARRLGEGRGRRAAQGRPARRTTTPTTPPGTKLARTTLDGIAVSPLGTPDLLDDLATDRPPGAGRRLGHPRPPRHRRRRSSPTRRRWSTSTNGVTSLWLEVEPDADLDTLLDGVLLDLAPVVLDVPADPVAAAEGFVAHAGDTDLADGTNLGADPLGARVRGVSTSATDGSTDVVVEVAGLAREAGTLGARRRRDRRPRPRCLRRPGARLLDGRRRGVPPDPDRRRHPARRRRRA